MKKLTTTRGRTSDDGGAPYMSNAYTLNLQKYKIKIYTSIRISTGATLLFADYIKWHKTMASDT